MLNTKESVVRKVIITILSKMSIIVIIIIIRSNRAAVYYNDKLGSFIYLYIYTQNLNIMFALISSKSQ